jgi:hypothetical protein
VAIPAATLQSPSSAQPAAKRELADLSPKPKLRAPKGSFNRSEYMKEYMRKRRQAEKREAGK